MIVVVEESLGAEFIGAYGDDRGLTPHLDRIARDSMVFTRTYASGTRTVRGLEAVTASFPPVPPEAIVKRPHNEGMFRHALKVYDEQHAKGELIFSVVMTTSNHKPFTFPPGIEGVLPAGGGRESGVRYADYALGKFFDELRRREYFDDTLLVIVADHGARVYGKEDFPLRSYEIPFLVYAPRHVKPERVGVLTSQLDVAPTVLGILGISYESAFFGRDALVEEHGVRQVPLNHNRDVALLAEGRLNQLGFGKTSSSLSYPGANAGQVPIARDTEGLKDVAAFFQMAYALYVRREYGVP